MTTTGVFPVAWKRCVVCSDKLVFKSPREFCRHLRDVHCTKEGGSFVCRYGPTGVCPSLPVDGVSDKDYEDHVARDHVAGGRLPTSSRNTSSRENSVSPPPPAPPPAPVIPISTEPSVVQDQHKWTVFNSTVNLPAVLNDPRLSRRENDFFTKTWGESFEKASIYPSPHLPVITRKHFEKYLHKTSGRYKKHKKNSDSSVNDDASQVNEMFPILKGRQIDKSRLDLDSIPKVFMSPNFSLENADTFNAVFPWTQIETARQDQTGQTRQSSKLLQEKLSHYLDIVEVQIAKQISMRAEAFFHAMTSHDKLQERMSQTCAAIKHLRDKIHILDSVLAKGSLDIMKLSRTRANYVILYNKLKLMATVHQTQPTIQLLLSTNEFVGALDLIGTTQEVLIQELGGIHCFRHLGSQLAEMEKLIDKMMQEDFSRYATSDLNRPLTELDKLMDEDQLVAIILGMLRQHRYQFIDIYREEACMALKAVLKQTVVEAVAEVDDVDTEGNISSLADQMRLLNYPKWMELLNNVFQNLMVILRRAKAVCDVILEVANLASGRLGEGPQTAQPIRQAETTESTVPATVPVETSSNPFDEPDEYPVSLNPFDEPETNGNTEGTNPFEDNSEPTVQVSLNQDVDISLSAPDFTKVQNQIHEMLCQICDHAHDRCVKVLLARAKDGFLEKLSSQEFVTLSRSVEAFVTDCENICGRRSTSLRGSLQSQANRFVNRFHDERKTKLSLILDNERWKQADVPAEFQDLVNNIAANGNLVLPEKSNEVDKKPSEFLQVNGERYAVVGTVLLLLKMVVEYCQCVDDMPAVTADILTRLIELLKMFNSRTCQLVLGAGALQLVGLKTITTKNLALASRCLQLVVQYIPQVKKHFEERIHGKQSNMLKHFDQILKDYKDHIQEISNKLVAIMDGMIDAQLTKWEVKAPMPSACFRNICKQITKLHEAIIDLLPASQVKEIFTRIHMSFKTHLKKQLQRLNVTNDGGPQHGLVAADVAFYLGSIKSLSGLKTLEDDISDIWQR